MEDVVKKDILNVLKKTIECMETRQCSSIESISNQVIHNASIFQDDYSTSVAVIIYGISQVVEKTDELNDALLKYLKKAKGCLEKNDEKQFSNILKKITNMIESEDFKLKNYFKHVISNAKINKGSKLYDHGISIGRIAEILGRSQWEIVSFLGKTNIPETYELKDNMEKRLNFARRLFGVKR